jgi:hypothetical protein
MKPTPRTPLFTASQGLVLATALGLAACSAPVRPDLPTIVSIDQWNSQTGQGQLRVHYRDNEPTTLEQLQCTLTDPHSDQVIGHIEQKPALPLDPYGTELVAFRLDFPQQAANSQQLDYRLRCRLQLGQRQEKTRFRSTLYRIPAENGLYR